MPSPAQLRNGQDALARLASRDLAAMWRQVSNAAQARVALDDVLPKLVRTYGVAASSMATDWYNEARAEAELSGSFRALPASLNEQGVGSLIDWGLDSAKDLESLKVLIEGGTQRRIISWSRETVMGASISDPHARGWQRVGVGECTFCEMLISRGAVYNASTADFGAHDHCRCAAVPAFNGAPLPVKPYEMSPRRKPSDGHSLVAQREEESYKKDQARAKAWIAKHLPN